MIRVVVFLYHFSAWYADQGLQFSKQTTLFSLVAFLWFVCTLWTPVGRFYTSGHQPCKFIETKKEERLV